MPDFCKNADVLSKCMLRMATSLLAVQSFRPTRCLRISYPEHPVASGEQQVPGGVGFYHFVKENDDAVRNDYGN